MNFILFFSLIWVEKLLLSVWISDETLLKVTLFNVASSFGYDTGINESPPPCVWYVTKTLSPNIMDVRLVTRSTFVDQQVVQPVAQYMLSTMSSKVQWPNKLVNAMKEKQRTLTKIETSAFVFNTLLQHFSTIKKEHPPYSQNLIASLFAVSVRCKPFP